MHGPTRPFSGPNGPARADQRVTMLVKVEALITVLELARGKVLAGLAAKGADAERLFQVRRQVEATLQVCRRARTALRGRGAPITPDEVAETDLDALCAQLAHWDLK